MEKFEELGTVPLVVSGSCPSLLVGQCFNATFLVELTTAANRIRRNPEVLGNLFEREAFFGREDDE